nr:MAG: hypothetical protein DIU72_08965 [Pseudomonadota bacterium]
MCRSAEREATKPPTKAAPAQKITVRSPPTHPHTELSPGRKSMKSPPISSPSQPMETAMTAPPSRAPQWSRQDSVFE